MKPHEHILSDYDVKLVGPEAEVLRYRKDVHYLEQLCRRLLAAEVAIEEPCAYAEHINRIRAHMERPRTTSARKP